MALTNKEFWLMMMYSADITKRILIGSQEIKCEIIRIFKFS